MSGALDTGLDRTEATIGKVYPEEVKKKALELDRLDDKTSYAEVDQDLGIPGETIRHWVQCRRRN